MCNIWLRGDVWNYWWPEISDILQQNLSRRLSLSVRSFFLERLNKSQIAIRAYRYTRCRRRRKNSKTFSKRMNLREWFIFLIILHFMGRWRVRLRLYTSYYITIRGIWIPGFCILQDRIVYMKIQQERRWWSARQKSSAGNTASCIRSLSRFCVCRIFIPVLMRRIIFSSCSQLWSIRSRLHLKKHRHRRCIFLLWVILGIYYTRFLITGERGAPVFRFRRYFILLFNSSGRDWHRCFRLQTLPICQMCWSGMGYLMTTFWEMNTAGFRRFLFWRISQKFMRIIVRKRTIRHGRSM